MGGSGVFGAGFSGAMAVEPGPADAVDADFALRLMPPAERDVMASIPYRRWGFLGVFGAALGRSAGGV